MKNLKTTIELNGNLYEGRNGRIEVEMDNNTIKLWYVDRVMGGLCYTRLL